MPKKLKTFWKTEIGSCSVTPLRARPHLWVVFFRTFGPCISAGSKRSWPLPSKCLGHGRLQLVDRATEIEVSRCSKS